MATEAHGKHGIFTDNFCVFRGFRGYLSQFRLGADLAHHIDLTGTARTHGSPDAAPDQIG
jgi:hypothetical protein